MSSGLRLFLQAERSYAGGRVDDTLSYYTKAITKILKSETLLAPLPPTFSHPAVPQEVLGVVWHNFAGFFRDPILKRTRENSPEAYKLLSSFRPNSHHEFQRFSTEQEKTYLAGMRISAGLTLALMAWDERDRATAAKRYRDAIEPVPYLSQPGQCYDSLGALYFPRCPGRAKEPHGAPQERRTLGTLPGGSVWHDWSWRT
ncbi:hypothetical protein CC2G_008359 [Coprinopsis cinerea AmutBmut pab1-1]|nr:hypothetical protein CC2G_008359 [Coprinopsis cinerea AmutBmut pab1-1]